MVRCSRCDKSINPKKSRFCTTLSESKYTLTYAADLVGSELALHVCGDRECGKESSGCRLHLKEKFPDLDLGFLDNY